jgi:hypothetical protein
VKRSTRQYSHDYPKEIVEARGLLHRVLMAYAGLDPEVNYVQGMNNIVSALLFHLHEYNFQSRSESYGEKTDVELLVFHVLVYIMRELNWRDIFRKDFKKIKHISEVLEYKLDERNKDLLDHIRYFGLKEPDSTDPSSEPEHSFFSLFFSSFLTIFTSTIPVDLTDRVLDLFLLEGGKLLVDIILRSLQFSSHSILNMTDKLVGPASPRSSTPSSRKP